MITSIASLLLNSVMAWSVAFLRLRKTIIFRELVKEENLSAERTERIIEDYLFAEREPLRDEVLELIEGDKPTVLERKKVGDRILKRIMDFVETFINGMTG